MVMEKNDCPNGAYGEHVILTSEYADFPRICIRCGKLLKKSIN